MNRNSTTAVPLVVDLDGTLVWTDTLLESALLLVRGRPLAIFLLVWWALHGKLRLKAELAARTTLDPQHLPWNQGCSNSCGMNGMPVAKRCSQPLPALRSLIRLQPTWACSTTWSVVPKR